MTDTLAHRLVTSTEGIHVSQAFDAANAAAITALSVTNSDRGKIARAADTGALYFLATQAAGVGTWLRFASTSYVDTAIAALSTTYAALDLAKTSYSGASNTMSTGAARTWVEVSHTTSTTLQLPLALPVGSTTLFSAIGAGQLTLSVSVSGATLRTPLTAKTARQWSPISLYVRATNDYVLGGDVATS